MSETIDLTPRGLTTPEGIARNRKAMGEFENATAELCNMLMQCLETNDTYKVSLWKLGLAPEEIDDVTQAINRRKAAQEEFLRSLTGAPPWTGR